ncbi:hypothetical protein ACVWWO_000988 [Bradyrhizobium sp. F1.13.1]
MRMGMRQIAIEAMRKRNAGVSTYEIDSFIRNQSALLGICVEENHPDEWYTIRLSDTGEIIRYDQNGYSYSTRG